MTSYGSRFPKGSKINSGSSYRSGKSEYPSDVFSELDIESMNRDELREIAKILGLSSRGSSKQLKKNIKQEIQKRELKMSGSEFRTDSEVKTATKYDLRTGYKTFRQGDYRRELASIDRVDMDSMLDDMSFRELRAFKKSLGIKGKANTKASLKRLIKSEIKKKSSEAYSEQKYNNNSMTKTSSQVNESSQVKESSQVNESSQVTSENLEKMSYSKLKSIVEENNLQVVREQGRRGRISKKELVDSIVKNSNTVSISEEYLQYFESKTKGKRGKRKVGVEIREETELEDVKGVLLPTNDYPIAEPEPEIGARGKELSTSRKKRKDWKKRKDLWNEYVEEDQFPFLAGYKSDSFDYVDPVHFETNLEEMKAIAEKPEFLTSIEKGNSTNYTTTKGNQIQTRILEGEFIGVFSQKRSGATKANPTPTLYKTKEIRTDDDDIGHYIAAINNMYAWNDPYKSYQYVQREGNWVKQSPDPLKVNRAHVKSMLDSAGFEQGKLTREVIESELGSKNVLTYRDTKGDTQDLSLSEQQLAICSKIVPEEASIIANTPASELIVFQIEDLEKFKGIDITTVDIDSIEFHPIDEPIETRGKKLTSDELLIAAVRKYDMQPHTVQSIAESLYHQGWITYPRTGEEKAEVEDVGVELRKSISEFTGSNEERKILTIVEQGNRAKQQGYNFLVNGYWELQIGDELIANSENTKIFFDERTSFSGGEVDLEVKQIGITPERLTNFLVENDIGTKSTRTQLLEELEFAGIVTLQLEDKEKIYRLDQRGLYMASTYEYLEDHPESKVTELGSRVKKAQTINDIKDIWEEYKQPDRNQLQEFIRNQTQIYLDIEKDLALIEEK